MCKIIAMHQPNYIPWLGYFYKISQSNIFVFVDDCQFSSSGMHSYHYIKSPQGLFRLRIPVDYKHVSKSSINEVRTKDELNWKKYHLKILMHNYKKSRHFEEVFQDFSNLLLKNYQNLADMDQAIIMFFCNKLGINTKFKISSSIPINSTKEERIIEICKYLNGNVYYSGTGARAYQREEYFIQNNINLVYSDFKPFQYYQPWGKFESNVSILDYLLEYGYDWSRVLENQRKVSS